MRTLAVKAIVLVPYKFTLLSNAGTTALVLTTVLVPYKFTLLSNRAGNRYTYILVLLSNNVIITTTHVIFINTRASFA